MYLSFELECEKNKSNQKEARIDPFLKQILPLPTNTSLSQVINDVDLTDTGHYVFQVEVKGGGGDANVLKRDVDLFLKVTF